MGPTTAPHADDDAVEATAGVAVEQETDVQTLIEDVSIDGMCGVY